MERRYFNSLELNCDTFYAHALEIPESCTFKALVTFFHTEIMELQWNPSIKATQDGGLSKEVACHEG